MILKKERNLETWNFNIKDNLKLNEDFKNPVTKLNLIPK